MISCDWQGLVNRLLQRVFYNSTRRFTEIMKAFFQFLYFSEETKSKNFIEQDIIYRNTTTW